MKIAVFVALGLLIYIFVVIWLKTKLRYQLTSQDFRITLFGFRLRRVPLERIQSVTKRRPAGLAENWSNTLHPSHRMLFIRLNRGLRKNLIITPRNRYVFKTELERTMAKLNPSAPLPSSSQDLEEASMANEASPNPSNGD